MSGVAKMASSRVAGKKYHMASLTGSETTLDQPNLSCRLDRDLAAELQVFELPVEALDLLEKIRDSMGVHGIRLGVEPLLHLRQDLRPQLVELQLRRPDVDLEPLEELVVLLVELVEELDVLEELPALLFEPFGFVEYQTNEPNICLKPENVFMGRIGKNVSLEVQNDFKWLRFGMCP